MLPDTSLKSCAGTPSKEFSWFYLQLLPTPEVSEFYRTEKDATNAAKDNYRNFVPSMNQYQVIVAQAKEGWNIDE